MTDTHYMGHTADYWLALESQKDSLKDPRIVEILLEQNTRLKRENANMRAQLGVIRNAAGPDPTKPNEAGRPPSPIQDPRQRLAMIHTALEVAEEFSW